MTLSNVARCGEVRRFGTGVHARTWQCRLQDPHPLGLDQPHDFGIDAEVFGRDLDVQRPEWLAASLRDAVSLHQHDVRRIGELTRIALQFAAGWAGSSDHRGADAIPATTETWLRDHSPAAAELLLGPVTR